MPRATNTHEEAAVSAKPNTQPPVPCKPAVEVDIRGALYRAVIGGLLALYEANDTFEMPYGRYTRDELVAEFQQFLREGVGLE